MKINKKLVILFVFFMLFQSTSLFAGWQTETICTDCDAMMDIAIDSSDNLHVFYSNSEHSALKYSSKDYSGWHSETVSAYGPTGWDDGYDIDIDSLGYPHIVFVTNKHQNLKYAFKNISGWHIEPIENYSYLNSFTAASLAIDSNNIAHVSYIDARAADFNVFEINYAYRNLNQWQIYPLNAHGAWGANTSIAVDSNNRPHISYNFVNTSDNISYLQYIHESLYSSETVLTGVQTGIEPQIALSPSGYPNIITIVNHNGVNSLEDWFKDTTGWHKETIFSTGNIASATLAIDAMGNPHISFNDITNANIKYAYKNATGWHIESIENFYSYSRIAVDSRGNPHLLYAAPGYIIKHAWYENPTLVTLSFLKALPKDRKIIIEWFTESETDNAGFNIYRATVDDGEYVKINDALIAAEGSTTQGATYEFTDSGLRNGKTYYYKLEDIGTNGISTFHGPVKAVPRWIYGIGK